MAMLARSVPCGNRRLLAVAGHIRSHPTIAASKLDIAMVVLSNTSTRANT